MRDIKYFFEQKVLNFLLPVTDRWLIFSGTFWNRSLSSSNNDEVGAFVAD